RSRSTSRRSSSVRAASRSRSPPGRASASHRRPTARGGTGSPGRATSAGPSGSDATLPRVGARFSAGPAEIAKPSDGRRSDGKRSREGGGTAAGRAGSRAVEQAERGPEYSGIAGAPWPVVAISRAGAAAAARDEQRDG